ncbi:MAG: 1,2-phenylacetyl-CoA epoxidase subunit PaaD [Chitinophagales bacterium]|nr:1,2-phenylacetyl-CoA epoxidase subunit PaaD [Chitinophagales bacterium]
MLAVENKTSLIWETLQKVADPEIPVISVVDMGMITQVELLCPSCVRIQMTPTFVGCPAISYLQDQIERAIKALGFLRVEVNVDFSTAWTSNRITEKGLQLLKGFRLSPPKRHNGEVTMESLQEAECPNCGSHNTSLNTPFGPTLCRALHFCYDCNQAFEQFKPV